MLQKFFATAIAMASLSAYAQDSAEVKPAASKPVITAAVDVYYRYNLSNPRKGAETFNNYTSFTNSQNSFELGMATVKLEHTFGKVGVVADLGFGRRAEEFSYNDDNTLFAIKQAYLTYSPWQNVKISAGSWATHVGYELVDAYANRNYSMSYMFSKGPFFHTGLKADFTAGLSGFMIGLANPTDLKTASFTNKYLIAQYSLASRNEKVKAYLNYQGGRSMDDLKMRQVDLTLTSAITDKWGIGYNGTYASSQVKDNGKYLDAKSWWGSAVYFNLDPKPWLSFTLREELFSDKSALTDVFSVAPSGGRVIASTLSANFKIANLTLIPEFRLDNSSRQVFVNHDGATKKSTATVLFAAVYKL